MIMIIFRVVQKLFKTQQKNPFDNSERALPFILKTIQGLNYSIKLIPKTYSNSFSCFN